ncbi:DNA mismatch repair protein [Pectobacterium atrosepticum SCRI1043]|uniref:DNA mismatch repair protein MutL n=1 Tax=Pectobacterium atrosepticum (strain SCRI 1043 / ATCC BAA-672) TaxID=218491 RepID=MUTL_PECAS|nr:DNA mismatch repair endonuclease MutL [Pectobacterium atrosepticum]Q6D065.1 RecName: Full=DNA mismatch repair protein MutL [Pectobacterium atrosepticum SCRI1043]GKV87022.1 DNA mismatch repair protein MutL [Pectobacterium carotovorum subsp. carotovorum]AIA72669.1 DNA mismatch repair protein [Pectobacterium atrosepticum]AIK15650.1 DNA mismatch repair protein MutL [Pectobacterium atrosepticum]KFX11427.1 DNA mismatch repair protein [Pectobacterium atrosepticum]KFX22834.1 DNA mismatch repair pr
MPIQVLPPQLANQIAAGEVVERPASVVKELVENSLDAGATRIDIDIERGGAKLIRIRDNGSGIGKDELTLALARHATSKIATLDDLEAIVSMGFRGEALASISSVSRLTLTSRTAEQSEAWQAYAEGRDMAVTVKPAAHPVGTTLEVLDLFYNTPARRKFMRTEKTEFTHIDEVVRRIALARFDVAITLHHNGKLMRQYRAAPDKNQYERRLGSICGATFLQHALAVSWQHGDLTIHGWVADPVGAKQLPDMQYCYVNQRMMRDRLINHAIRQAYQDQLSDEQQPAYVLYLEIDPHQVDVNVHPAKQEVRFHQARLVHDFIYQAVMSVLQQASAPRLDMTEPETGKPVQWQQENRPAAGENHFAQPPRTTNSPSYSGKAPRTGQARESANSGYQPENPYQKKQDELYKALLQPTDNGASTPPSGIAAPSTVLHDSCPNRTATNTAASNNKQRALVESPLESQSTGFGRVLTVYPPCYALLEYHKGLAILSLPVAERYLKVVQLTPSEEGLRAQPLLIPQRLTLSKSELNVLSTHHTLLTRFGIDVFVESQRATLRAVPLPLRQQNLQNLISELIGYLADYQTVETQQVEPDALASWMATRLQSEQENWSHSQAIQLLADVERLCPQLAKTPPSELLYMMDIHDAIKALKHE